MRYFDNRKILDLATVITNLMSAIPWVGQDIVEFLWGGLSQLLIEEPNNNYVVEQILLYAGISPIVLKYVCFININVKKFKSRGQSAEVKKLSTFEASQRLNAKNLRKSSLYFIFSTASCVYSYSNSHITTSLFGISKRVLSTKAFTGSSEFIMLNTKVGKGYLPSSYVSGLVDGEGCFHIALTKNSTFKAEFQVRAIFSIKLHMKDLMLLERIKSFYGVGTIHIRKGKSAGCAIYSIQSYKELVSVIIPFFDKYPLLTQKKGDYLLFKFALGIINKGEHLTKQGLSKLISIKASMNLGLSNQLKTIFSNIQPLSRPIINNSSDSIKIDPEWLAGFVTAEGNFLCLVRKQITYKSGYQVLLSFTLSQNKRDKDLMFSIKEYLGCGNIYEQSEIVNLNITKKSAWSNLLIPFFSRYPLHGSKSLDFEDLCKIYVMVKDNLHKTKEGLDKINSIKRGMNKARTDE